jgi:3-dehydrosphinganine reductase
MTTKIRSRRLKQQPFAGQSSIIAGGSQGIGLAVAQNVVRLGGSVCVVAIGALEEAKKLLESLRVNDAQFVDTILCDTTHMAEMRAAVDELVDRRGVPQHLFNFVGYAYANYAQNLTFDDFERNMTVNYYGQLVPTLAVLPHYLKGGRGGHICFTSSMLGYLGIIGYATYSPTKHALVGLAETLRHELKPFGITVSILYPPDTKTPGFEKENETKPPECAMISEKAEVLSVHEVAASFIEGVLNRRFQILPGKAKLYWRLFRYFPGVVRMLLDGDYAKARKKLGKT